MSRPSRHERSIDEILARIRSLSPADRSEVARLVERLSTRSEPSGIDAFERLSERAFEPIWDNSDDSAYDAL